MLIGVEPKELLLKAIITTTQPFNFTSNICKFPSHILSTRAHLGWGITLNISHIRAQTACYSYIVTVVRIKIFSINIFKGLCHSSEHTKFDLDSGYIIPVPIRTW